MNKLEGWLSAEELCQATNRSRSTITCWIYRTGLQFNTIRDDVGEVRYSPEVCDQIKALAKTRGYRRKKNTFVPATPDQAPTPGIDYQKWRVTRSKYNAKPVNELVATELTAVAEELKKQQPLIIGLVRDIRSGRVTPPQEIERLLSEVCSKMSSLLRVVAHQNKNYQPSLSSTPISIEELLSVRQDINEVCITTPWSKTQLEEVLKNTFNYKTLSHLTKGGLVKLRLFLSEIKTSKHE